MTRRMKMNLTQYDLLKAVETALKDDFMPKVTEIIDRKVASGIEEAFQRKVTRMESLEKYLGLLYEAQRSDYKCHDEIREALEQYKKEAGI
jgi:hypothetical protein